MKSVRIGRAFWLAVAGAAALAAGCGARPASESPSPAVTGASTNEVSSTNGVGVAAGDASSAPAPVRRSDAPAMVLPSEVAEVVKLVEAGAGDEVVRAYVASSQVPFELTLDQIIYLRDIGVADGVIAAMMRRGSELRDRANETEAMQTNLVSAVEQIRQAIATNGPASAASASDAVASTPAGEAPGPAPGQAATAPPPSPVVSAAAAPPADAPQEVNQFYSSLSPYGTWYQVPSYGWVWQPSVVVVNNTWAPYYHGGRWVWSDWGWYWSSDYSWGWAPFHYGRWCTYPGLGWCWVPGSVWGPSWVTWRHCDTHIGWAPLPPACGWSAGVGLTWHGGGVSVGFGFGLASSCYTFVPYDRFCHRSLHDHGIRGHQATAIYNQTTVVNNVIHGDNNVIVNNGVGLQTVASRTRSEVPKVRVESLPNDSNRPLKADRMERGRDGMVVYKPAPVATPGGQGPTGADSPGHVAPIRSEVRPRGSTPIAAGGAGAMSPGSTRSTVSTPLRPNAAAPAGGDSFARKPVESRGASGFSAPSATPSGAGTSGRAPSVTSARPSYGSPAAARSVPVRGGVPSTASKGTETRAGGAAGSSGASPGAVVGPSRQTTPVPLGDPSRNLPAGAREVPSRSVGSAPSVAKPPTEYRGGSASGGGSIRSAPSVPTYNSSARSPVTAPSAAPRVSSPSAYSAPAPSMTPPSRPSYTAPSPTFSAPSRPSYSTPTPSVAPPSYSSPSSAGGLSRPAMSMPSPSAGPVSSPAASSSPGSSPGGGSRGGGSRTQPN